MRFAKRVLAKHLRIAPGMPPLEMHTQIARLTVLYEDLRIELVGASEAEGSVLDMNEPIYRKC